MFVTCPLKCGIVCVCVCVCVRNLQWEEAFTGYQFNY